MIDPVKEKLKLEEDIKRLESEVSPLQQELTRMRQALAHLDAYLALTKGGESPVAPRNSKNNGGKRGLWKKEADEKGWRVGGDSAHRVVRRMDPGLHASIPHWCPYDNRAYP